MPKRALTKAAVERIKPPTKGQVDHFDAGYPGLSLRVSYGGGKSWIFLYRLRDKKQRMTLGTFPALGLADARDAWRDARDKVAKGMDPTAERKRAKREAADDSTLISAIGPAYIEHRAVRKGWKPSYREQADRLFNSEVLPHWRKRRVQDITRDDATDLLADIVERIADDGGRGLTANRVYATILSPMFQWCVDRRKIKATPLPSKEALLAEGALVEERERDRVLTDAEIKWLWKACDAENGLFGPFYQLALVTGQRRSEIAGMREGELDIEAKRWTIPGDRTKNGLEQIVPLSDLALSIIGRVPTIANDQGFIFCTNGETHISGYSRAKVRIAEAMERQTNEAIPYWVPHDLRRTLVTHMNEELNVAPHVVEACVNHVSGDAKKGVAGTYNRALYIAERIKAFAAWAAYLEALTSGKADSNVVALRK